MPKNQPRLSGLSNDRAMPLEELAENEHRFRKLVENLPDAIVVHCDGEIVFVNPFAVRLHGAKTPQQLLGRDISEFIKPECLPIIKRRIEQCYVTGVASAPLETVLIACDGSPVDIEVVAIPISWKGAPAIEAVLRDIRKRKRAEEAADAIEEKYRKLFENASYGIFLSKPDGTLLDVNPALVKILGYASKEELLTRNLCKDIYEDVGVREAILRSYGDGSRADGFEAKWKRKDGKTIHVQISGGVFRKKDGAVSHYEVIIEDISERRRLEQQYRQSQKMEAVGLLAGGISHDFNNLLGVILGNADLLLERTESGPQRRYAEAIKKAGGSAVQLVRQLLAFSRRQVLYTTILDVNAVVCEVGKILDRLIGEDVRIVTDLETRLGSVRADRGQIEQILMNLATNARDAMPSGGVFTIRTDNAELGPDDVSRYPYVKSGLYVHVAVSDTGVGMSEEIRMRVFEPFFTTKEKGRGTGLGLATVYGIVKQSGGYIWVSSRPGAGATFNIYLPRVDEKPLPVIPTLQVRSEYPRGTETILLLEDDDSLRQVTYEFLTASGYNVLQAGRGEAAIDLANQHRGAIPLIVSDVVLPEMSGPSAVSKLQALHPEMQVLYVSGYAEVPVAQELVARRAIVMQKPVSRMDLLKKVNEMLKSRKAQA
jgi:two-component system, cell cycle sensor histidine kinase and response regulator CckA